MNDKAARTEHGASAVLLLEQELERVETGIRFRRAVRSTIAVLVTVAAAAVLAATLLVPVLQICGASMSPALRDGEIVAAVRTGSIGRGELVAFYYGNKVLIKRCIGIAGDRIEMDAAGNVSVNGQVLEEPYLTEKAAGTCDITFPYQVPDGRLFVMGDQRATSIDSRNELLGCVAEEQIIGKVVFRLWPLRRMGSIR